MDVAKKVLDLYNAYMEDNQNALLRNLRDYSDLQGDCAKSGCIAISGRNELSGDKGIYFAINNNIKQIVKCSVRNLTAGPMDYMQIDLGIRGEYPDYLIDMNGLLVCGCYDKNNNWKEINNVRYVHIYGFKEHNGSGDFSKAFSNLEAKFQDVEIKKSEKDYGFETPYYDSKNRNYPIRMVFEMSDSPSVWNYGGDMKGNNQWDTVMNTCVGITKVVAVLLRSDNR